MNQTIALLSPTAFVIVLISFLLPWVSFSCSGNKFASLTGLDIVTGTTIERPTPGNENREETIPSDAFAIVTLALTVFGLILALLQRWISSLFPAISALAATITLLLVRSRIENEVGDQTRGLLHADFEFGFWLAFLSLLAATIISARLFMERRKAG